MRDYMLWGLTEEQLKYGLREGFMDGKVKFVFKNGHFAYAVLPATRWQALRYEIQCRIFNLKNKGYHMGLTKLAS